MQARICLKNQNMKYNTTQINVTASEASETSEPAAGGRCSPQVSSSLSCTTKGAEVPKRASAANHRVGNTTANQERSTISIDAISCYERLYDLAVRRIVDAEKVIEYLMFMIFKLKLGQAMYEYTLKHLLTNLSTNVKDEKDMTIAGQLFVSLLKSGLVLNDQDYWEPAMKEILNILKNNNSKSTLYILILNFIEGLKRDIGERMQYRSLNEAFRIIEKTINERIRKEKELIEEKAMLKIREEKQSAPPLTVNTIKNYLKTNVKRTAYNRKEAEDYAIRVKSFCCDQTETTAHELDRVKKYWLMRKLLFQRFDCGILLDHESFYFVCPEVLGKHIANRCRFPDGVAVDPFCGAGGNVIQLAATCRKVIAMDIDPIKLKLARHNADIYRCQDRIEFRENDYFGGTTVQTGDVVVTSPPWGGPEYLGREVYSLSSMCEENGGGEAIVRIAKTMAPNLALHLPRTVDKNECVAIARKLCFRKIKFEDNFIAGRLNSTTVFFS